MSRIAFVWVSVVAFALAGCGAPSKKSPARSQLPMPASQPANTSVPNGSASKLTMSDPCASRLHDLCGPLLVYLTAHYGLPEQLEELRQVPGSENVELTCPLSKQPYVYNPKGIVGPNAATRAVVYDAVPHGGYRCAIIVREATPNVPFIAEAVKWPESRFPRTASAHGAE